MKINYYAQSVPIIPRREWEVEAQNYRTFAFRGTVSAGSTSTVISYTTSSDEELYLCDLAFVGHDTGDLWIIIGTLYRFMARVNGGLSFSHAFSLPLRVPPDTDLDVRVSNPTSADVYYEVYLWGYTKTV